MVISQRLFPAFQNRHPYNEREDSTIQRIAHIIQFNLVQVGKRKCQIKMYLEEKRKGISDLMNKLKTVCNPRTISNIELVNRSSSLSTYHY